MPRRPKITYVKCAELGCTRQGRFEYDNLRHADAIHKQNDGQWRCDVHCYPNRMRPGSQVRELELTVYSETYGKFWAPIKNGCAFFLGGQAFAENFPVGTRLRIRAEIVLPNMNTEEDFDAAIARDERAGPEHGSPGAVRAPKETVTGVGC